MREYLKEIEEIKARINVRKIHGNLLKDEYNRLQHEVEKLAVENFKDEALMKEICEEMMIEVPTLSYNRKIMKAIGLAIVFLFPFVLHAQDTIHVKNVYVNNRSVKVKSGYIIHKNNDTWEVNGKEVHLYAYKQTDNPKYRPEEDSLTAKK